MLHKLLTGAAALAVLGFLANAANADRKPTPEEQAMIEHALNVAGYSGWEEIELDDDVWEVDDAVGEDGKKYDLELNVTTLAIEKKRRNWPW